jgi:hypothetical protein
MDGEFCDAAAGNDVALRDFVGVHNANNEILAVAGALDVLEQLVDQVFLDARPKKGWMERYHALHVVKEKHGG